MKKYLICICIFVLTVNIMAQNINYIPYYHLVNRANLVKCTDANCDSAIMYYSQAFEMVDYILLEDLRNFTQCAAELGKDSLVYYTMDKCIEQTVYLSYVFYSDSLFDTYKNTEKWKECYTIEQENIEKYKEKQAIGVLYKKVLDSLMVSDQAIRNKANWFYRTFPNSKRAKKMHREWTIIDSCNQIVLDEMIEKYDFPNEQHGLWNNPLFIRGGGGIVFVHYDDTNFLRNIEYKALLEGKLSPDYYADRINRIAIIFNWDKTNYTYYYTKKMTLQEKEQVNRNRHAIGLLSVEEENKIIQCNRIAFEQRKALAKKQKKSKKK